jgi:hypothetical protein
MVSCEIPISQQKSEKVGSLLGITIVFWPSGNSIRGVTVKCLMIASQYSGLYLVGLPTGFGIDVEYWLNEAQKPLFRFDFSSLFPDGVALIAGVLVHLSVLAANLHRLGWSFRYVHASTLGADNHIFIVGLYRYAVNLEFTQFLYWADIKRPIVGRGRPRYPQVVR